jgi:hypothetical protein
MGRRIIDCEYFAKARFSMWLRTLQGESKVLDLAEF